MVRDDGGGKKLGIKCHRSQVNILSFSNKHCYSPTKHILVLTFQILSDLEESFILFYNHLYQS